MSRLTHPRKHNQLSAAVALSTMATLSLGGLVAPAAMANETTSAPTAISAEAATQIAGAQINVGDVELTRLDPQGFYAAQDPALNFMYSNGTFEFPVSITIPDTAQVGDTIDFGLTSRAFSFPSGSVNALDANGNVIGTFTNVNDDSIVNPALTDASSHMRFTLTGEGVSRTASANLVAGWNWASEYSAREGGVITPNTQPVVVSAGDQRFDTGVGITMPVRGTVNSAYGLLQGNGTIINGEQTATLRLWSNFATEVRDVEFTLTRGSENFVFQTDQDALRNDLTTFIEMNNPKDPVEMEILESTADTLRFVVRDVPAQEYVGGNIYNLIVPTVDGDASGEFFRIQGTTVNPNDQRTEDAVVRETANSQVLFDKASDTYTWWINESVNWANAAGSELFTPLAADDAATTPFETPVTINVLDNDEARGDGVVIDSWDYTGPIETPDGAWDIDEDWNAVFTPAPGFTGVTQIPYEIVDSNGYTANATITVTVEAAPEPEPEPAPAPEATDDVFITEHNTPVTFDPRVNDDFPAGEVRFPGGETELVVEGEGAYVVNDDNTVTFTPVDGFSGPVTPVPYTNTFEGETIEAEITGEVGEPVEEPAPEPAPVDPIEEAHVGTTPNNTPITLDLCEDQDWVEVSFADGATTLETEHGVYELTDACTVVFTPASPEVVGELPSIPYTGVTQDGTPGSGTVTITVEEPEAEAPEAAPDRFVTAQDTPVTFDPRVNDDFPDGEITFLDGEVELVIEGEGTYVINENNTVTFTPEPGFVGEVTPVTYLNTQDGLTVVSEITGEVTPVEQAPAPEAADDVFTTEHNTPVTFDPRVNDDFPTGLITFPGGETELVVEGEGTYVVNEDNTVTFTPVDGFSGSVTPVPYLNTFEGETIEAEITGEVGEPAEQPAPEPEVPAVIEEIHVVTTPNNTPVTVDLCEDTAWETVQIGTEGSSRVETEHGVYELTDACTVVFTPAGPEVVGELPQLPFTGVTQDGTPGSGTVTVTVEEPEAEVEPTPVEEETPAPPVIEEVVDEVLEEKELEPTTAVVVNIVNEVTVIVEACGCAGDADAVKEIVEKVVDENTTTDEDGNPVVTEVKTDDETREQIADQVNGGAGGSNGAGSTDAGAGTDTPQADAAEKVTPIQAVTGFGTEAGPNWGALAALSVGGLGLLGGLGYLVARRFRAA